eukprot:3329127-Heterocapsa_arctica.AAC.1
MHTYIHTYILCLHYGRAACEAAGTGSIGLAGKRARHENASTQERARKPAGGRGQKEESGRR